MSRFLQVLVLVAMFAPALHARTAVTQSTCDPRTLAPGYWTGTYRSAIERSWTDVVPDLNGTRAMMLGTWAGTMTIQGHLDVFVDGDGTVRGTSRGSWQARVQGDRDDGVSYIESDFGWLSGGSVTMSDGADLGVQPQLEWDGAWWTGAIGVTMISHAIMIKVPGQQTLYGDGNVRPVMAPRLAFVVAQVTCNTTDLTFDAAQFWYPARGRTPDSESVTAPPRFQLRRQAS